jgi:hypothetical protein
MTAHVALIWCVLDAASPLLFLPAAQNSCYFFGRQLLHVAQIQDLNIQWSQFLESSFKQDPALVRQVLLLGFSLVSTR